MLEALATDLKIIETSNGGDAVQAGNDLAMAGINNMLYLACFSGDGKWWGNDLLMPNLPDIHFVSETEQVLQTVALNSSGRIRIEQALKKDLAFLEQAIPGTTIMISASIVSDDRLEIKISANGEQLYYLWDAEVSQLYQGFTTPSFLSFEMPGFILTQNGINYFIPE